MLANVTTDGKTTAEMSYDDWMAVGNYIAELEATIGELKAAFRVNMLRRAQPGEDIDAEIDRVFAELERKSDPMAEHDKEAAAVATLTRLGYTHDGGIEWKPPLGPSAAPLLDRIAELEEALDEIRCAASRYEVRARAIDDADPRFQIWDRSEHCYRQGYWLSRAKAEDAVRLLVEHGDDIADAEAEMIEIAKTDEFKRQRR